MSRTSVLLFAAFAAGPAGLALSLALAPPAAAQESVVRSAADAFGERQGIEQVGLYNEGQVRGFDLNSSGAYRIDDAYFSRAAPLNDPVLAGVAVRVGVNAARLAYPAPSGVVNYRLREPLRENSLSIGGGLRDYGTRTLEVNGSWRTDDDRFGLAGGLVWRPFSQWGPGTRGEALDIGLVARLRLDERQTLRAFATTYEREYDGDYAFLATDKAVPPNPRRFHNYSPEWAKVAATNTNFGALYAGRFGPWSVDASAFRSIYDPERQDFTVIAVDRDGDATATLFLQPQRKAVADSAELRVARVFEAGEFSHLLSASVRGRHSEVELATSMPVPLGPLTLATDVAPSTEPAWRGSRGLDTVEQLTASAGYGLVWADRLQVRLGAHRTRYEKNVLTVTGARSSRTEEVTLYNASVVYSLNDRASVFGSWVTGLEESGFAPQTATNRNEVLPPVEAEQMELGIRYTVTPSLTFIGALFDVSKPTPGFRADGSFGLVGQVRHRGVEGSLAGRLDPRTSVVLGAVVFDPKLSGPLVDSGAIGDHPPGVSAFVANASVERQLGAGWSVDAQANYQGRRFADTANTWRTPGVFQVNLGARRRFEVAGRQAQFRVLASNLNNAGGYWSSPGGLLFPVGERTVRALFTVTFGGPPATLSSPRPQPSRQARM